MADCARAGLALDGNEHLRERVQVVEADVSLDGKAREAGRFPARYLRLGDRQSALQRSEGPRHAEGREGRRACDGRGTAERWIKTACAIARPGSGLSVIARPQSIVEILAAMEGRYGAVTVLPGPSPPVETGDPHRRFRHQGLAEAMEVRPPLFLHDEDGGTKFSARAEAITNGRETLLR
jgi:hypothetical protein